MLWDLDHAIQLKTVKPQKDNKQGGKKSKIHNDFVQTVVEQIKTLQPRKGIMKVHTIIRE